MNLPQGIPSQSQLSSQVETLLSLLHEEKRVLDDLIANLETRQTRVERAGRRSHAAAGRGVQVIPKRS